MKLLLNTLSSYMPLPPPLEAYLLAVLDEQTLPAGSVLLAPGNYSRKVFFITEGMAMKYYIRNSEKVVTWFMHELDFFLSADSFFNRKPSDEYIELIEKTHLYSLTRQQFLDIKKAFHEIVEITEQIQRKYYIQEKSLVRKFRSLTNIEKYHYLQEQCPRLIQRVPLKYIASFLQMSPQHLSRIRKYRR